MDAVVGLIVGWRLVTLRSSISLSALAVEECCNAVRKLRAGIAPAIRYSGCQ